MQAGNLSSRITFAEMTTVDGEGGEIIQGWMDRFTVWGAVKYLRGTEVVMQARMQSRRPAILTIRDSAQARLVTSEWHATIDGVVYQVREDPRPTEDRGFLEMLAEG